MTTHDVRAAGWRAKYSTHRPPQIAGPALSLPNYWQEDYYSCGFLAALTVAHYFEPALPPELLLRGVRPSKDYGTPRRRVVAGLRSVGIRATYRPDLTFRHLWEYIRDGTPVIISVWPSTWPGDHWTVMRGFTLDRVYLTNYWSLSSRAFREEWIDNWGDGSKTGAGLVCRRV